MDHEAGEEYDCEACGDTHVVQRGKGLDVAGSDEGLDPALYVRCPDAGFVSLSDPAATGGDDGGDDWP
jgi:hypothetical protein